MIVLLTEALYSRLVQQQPVHPASSMLEHASSVIKSSGTKAYWANLLVHRVNAERNYAAKVALHDSCAH